MDGIAVIVAVAALLCVIAYQGWLLQRQEKRIDDFLDRITARSFQEYKISKVAEVDEQVASQIVTDEQLAAMEASGQFQQFT